MNKGTLNKRFRLEERKTSVTTEVLAGLTTFATMSYILAVQPSMMADAGMNSLGVFAATAKIGNAAKQEKSACRSAIFTVSIPLCPFIGQITPCIEYVFFAG